MFITIRKYIYYQVRVTWPGCWLSHTLPLFVIWVCNNVAMHLYSWVDELSDRWRYGVYQKWCFVSYWRFIGSPFYLLWVVNLHGRSECCQSFVGSPCMLSVLLEHPIKWSEFCWVTPYVIRVLLGHPLVCCELCWIFNIWYVSLSPPSLIKPSSRSAVISAILGHNNNVLRYTAEYQHGIP